jgi:cell division septation protein DedD
MTEEGFHELQLNGKQLVFLFMAATVVAVVIFLCGVMVGRGVRPRPELADLSVQAATDPTANVQAAPRSAEPSSGNPATSSGSAAAQEQLTYPQRLAEPASPPEVLTEPSTSRPSVVQSPRARNAASDPPSSSSAPSGEGFTVQVAAVKERGEAETIARRLTTRGFPAYVLSPAAGAPRVYRVRVGRFKERRDAESIAVRLEKQEQFRPWITR